MVDSLQIPLASSAEAHTEAMVEAIFRKTNWRPLQPPQDDMEWKWMENPRGFFKTCTLLKETSSRLHITMQIYVCFFLICVCECNYI